MNREKMLGKVAGLEPWFENFGFGMERRGADGASWYDLSINCNSLPCETELAIIVTSWCGQLKWLKATLAAYRMTGAFVILAFDNPFYSWSAKTSLETIKLLPNVTHYILANSVVFKHATYDCNKRNGWFWDVRYAQGIIRQFSNIKYVYCTNGDCICENPDGFKEVIKLLGDGELMSGQSTEGLVHTADVLYKVDAFNKIFDSIFEVMRVPVIGSHSPEGMLIEAVEKLKLKVVHAPEQPISPIDQSVDMYACYGQFSTWRKLLGFRNLFAEYETAGNEGAEPPDKKYIDNYEDFIYFNGEERMTICKYWETGDRRYLYQWWDAWEGSWYNRIYYPLEFFSKEPIYG